MASINFTNNQSNYSQYKSNQWNIPARPSSSTEYHNQLLGTKSSRLYDPETIQALSRVLPDINANPQNINGARGPEGTRSGTTPTRTYGKDMYFSLDVHGGDQDNLQQVVNAVKEFPNINFTLYFYEWDKGKIPSYLKALPGVGVGLHIGPSGKAESVERFYNYIKENNIQPIHLTPASIHGSGNGRLTSEVMEKLDEYNVPFIRTADSVGTVSGKLRNVIPANFPDIEDFKTDPRVKNFNHYFTHANQIDKSDEDFQEQAYNILDYFNKGVGR